MTATEHALSIDELRETTAATIDRVNRTGEVQAIMVDSKARSILLSPTLYDAMAKEYWLSHDVRVIRQSIKDIEDGKGLDARVMFDELHAELLAMLAAESEAESAAAAQPVAAK